MFDFKVFKANQPEWDEVVKSSFIYDFHHTAFYHDIDNNNESVLLVAKHNSDFIALPLVIRVIDGTNWNDATSVYGYCGPVSNQPDFKFSSNLVQYFIDQVTNYCNTNNIISVFSRLHPLINQEAAFQGFGDVVHLSKTVAIDLRLPPEEQYRQYRKSNKSEINQLRRKGFSTEIVQSNEDIDSFISIYYETMDRVSASKYYYFSKDYFYSFLNNQHFANRLIIAKFEEKPVAGAIFTITDKIMQYHLAGTAQDFIRATPMKLILDDARKEGNTLGLDYLHLGGGVGGNDVDSLFKFKAGFSSTYCQFSVWKHIVDHEKYNSLLIGMSEIDNSFFPAYRKKQ